MKPDIGHNGYIGIIKMKFLQVQNRLSELQIPKERLEVGLYRLDKIVIDRLRNVVTEEGRSPAVIKMPCPSVKQIFFNRMGQDGRQGMFMVLIGLIILKKDLLADIMMGVY